MPLIPFFDYSQLTTAEIDWVSNAAGLTYAKGTILVADAVGTLNALAVGTNTHVLTADSSQTLGIKWTSTGTGDVVGPGSATNNAIVRFDTTTGKLIQDSGVFIDDSDNLTLGDNQILYFDTAKTKGFRYDTDHSGIVIAGNLHADAALSIYANTGADALGNWEPYISLLANGGVTIENIAQGEAVARILRVGMVGGLQLTAGTQPVLMKTTNLSTNREVEFPNASGTLALTSDLVSYLPLAGGTMAGAIAMGTNKITGMGNPTLAQDATTKSYVDLAIGFLFDYFFNDTSAGIGATGYLNMTDTDLGGAESDIETIIGSSGDDKPLDAMFISLVGEPGVEQIEAGVYDFHFHAAKTAGSSAVDGIYIELYQYETDTTENLLGTTEISGAVTSVAGFDIHMVLTDSVDLATTDRLLVKFYANLSGGAGATVNVYVEGVNDSHFSFNVSSAILSSLFIRQDGTTAFSGNQDFGTNDITGVGSLGVTGTRLTKGWFTDLEVTNAIAGSITGNAATVSTITTLAPDTATTQATQASITTCANLVSIGTIATGVWEGTDVGIAHGGTGSSTLAGASIPTYTSTNTFTNKRITQRITTEASSATPTINTDNTDLHSITALAAAITSMTTNLSGTPTNGQKLIVRILDNATGRAIAWGASFEDNGVALPTTTTASKLLTVGFIYDTASSKWGCVAVADET